MPDEDTELLAALEQLNNQIEATTRAAEEATAAALERYLAQQRRDQASGSESNSN